MNTKLKSLDKQIEMWEKVVENYPLSEAYRNNLLKLKNERDLEASKIGRVEK